MRVPWIHINIYLLLALLAGCSSTNDEDKDSTQIYLHLEVNRTGNKKSMRVPVYRADPFMVNVEESPFLHNGYLVNATLNVNPTGGHTLSLKFDRHGTLVLNSASVRNRGRRVAIHCVFGQSRWIAAPVLRHRIDNGVLTFTPDATEEECNRIVRGLNNVADELFPQ